MVNDTIMKSKPSKIIAMPTRTKTLIEYRSPPLFSKISVTVVLPIILPPESECAAQCFRSMHS